jgi:alpha-tubulin suppressor-like RCC1 family protein
VLSGVAAVAAGSEHTCALMASGGIRCWGLNSSGCLGTTPPDHTTPNPVVGICQ